MTRRRVLVVEDNVDAAEMLGALVDTLGHEVRVVHRAEDALALLTEWSADIVLSDIGLPDVDGFDFARRLRAGDASCAGSALLVAISGYGSARDITRARDAGFDVHLTKPVDMKKLETLLQRPPEPTA